MTTENTYTHVIILYIEVRHGYEIKDFHYMIPDGETTILNKIKAYSINKDSRKSIEEDDEILRFLVSVADKDYSKGCFVTNTIIIDNSDYSLVEDKIRELVSLKEKEKELITDIKHSFLGYSN